MKNAVVSLTTVQAEQVKTLVNMPDTKVVSIPCRRLKTVDDYLCFMEEALLFPYLCEGVYERYLDQMQSLSWLPFNRYVFFFDEYEHFLSSEPDYCVPAVREDFENILLPWWENGDAPKSMTVYIVEGAPYKSDWRLTNQEAYLTGKQIESCIFRATPTSDHEHCAFCWETFSDGDEALCTEDKRHWICKRCFRDFKARFAWIIK